LRFDKLWIETFARPRIEKFVRIGPKRPMTDRTWCLRLADRVLLPAKYHRTNPTMRRITSLFGIL